METPIPGHCQPPFRYPRRVKDTALEVWGFRCGRDFACTLREVSAIATAEAWPCLPTVDTLREWAKVEDWHGEIAARLRAIAPGMAERAIADLILAGCEGAAYIRDVVTGRVKGNMVTARLAGSAVSAIGLDALARQEFAGMVQGQSYQPSPSALSAGSPAVDSGDALRSAVVARLLAAEHEES